MSDRIKGAVRCRERLTVVVGQAQSRRVEAGLPLARRQTDDLVPPRSRPGGLRLRDRRRQVWGLAKYLTGAYIYVMCVCVCVCLCVCVFVSVPCGGFQ